MSWTPEVREVEPGVYLDTPLGSMANQNCSQYMTLLVREEGGLRRGTMTTSFFGNRCLTTRS